jgi:hypothetical protein
MSFRDIFRRATAAEKRAKRKAAVNKTNLRGTSDLFIAVEHNNLNDMRVLLREGADVNGRSKTPGFIAGMMFDVPYAAGSTPLHAAALNAAPQAAALLLRNGADVNVRNNAGYTALDYALMSHAWLETTYQRKKDSILSTERGIRTAEENMKEGHRTVTTLLEHGAMTGLLELPAQFRNSPAAPRKNKNAPGLG